MGDTPRGYLSLSLSNTQAKRGPRDPILDFWQLRLDQASGKDRSPTRQDSTGQVRSGQKCLDRLQQDHRIVLTLVKWRWMSIETEQPIDRHLSGPDGVFGG